MCFFFFCGCNNEPILNKMVNNCVLFFMYVFIIIYTFAKYSSTQNL